MTKKHYFLFLMLSFLFFSCNGKEITGFGNPKIGKIVQITKVTILSESKNDMIYPKYEIELKLIAKCKINSLHLRSNYLFGQDLTLLSSKDVVLSSKEMELLNTVGKCNITLKLDPVKKENTKNEFSEGILNEERISNVFFYLKYR